MAGRSLGTLTLDLIAKTGMFEAGLDKAGRKMSETERKAHSLGKNIGAALAGVGTAVGAAVVAGATAAAVAVDKAIDQMDELYNASQKIGIPVEVLSGFKYAAELSGVSIDQLQTGMGKLVKFQQDAAQGGKESTRVFEAFGIAVKDSEGNLRKTQDLIKDFADVFKALPDGPEQAALALQVFGKSGLELVPLLNAGSDGIQEMMDRARELGLVFDDEAGAKADEFNDKLDELKGAVGGLATQVAIELLPELIELVDWFRENYTEGSKLKETADAIAAVVEFAGDRIASFSQDVQRLTAAFSLGVSQADAYYQAVTSLATLDFDRAAQAKNNAIASFGAFSGTMADIGAKPKPRANFRDVISSTSGKYVVDRVAQARSLQSAMPKSAKAARGKKDNSEADALRDAERAARDYQAAVRDLNGVLDDQAKITGGELTQAAMAYREEMLKIQETETELQRLGKLDAETSVAIAQAREQATALYEKEVEAIQSRKTPAQELLADMEFELSLIGMTNEQKSAEIALRNLNIDAMSKEGQALRDQIVETEEAITAANRNQQAIEGFKGSFEDAFTSILDGSKGIKDAFTDLADSIVAQIARMLAQKWTEQLFGMIGGGASSGGSSGGGFWAGLIGSFFGGGSAKGNIFNDGSMMAFANGGVIGGPTTFPMAGGKFGLMGEAGPEAIMPLERGPGGKLGIISHGGGGKNLTQNFIVQGAPNRQTQEQMARASGREARRGLLRTG